MLANGNLMTLELGKTIPKLSYISETVQNIMAPLYCYTWSKHNYMIKTNKQTGGLLQVI